MPVLNIVLILVLILLLTLAVSFFLYLVIRRTRRVSFTPDDEVKPQVEEKNPSPVEFLQYASDLELRTSFRRALRVLKHHVTGRDYRYHAPWYLLAGESKSGKTSLLDSNGLKLSINDAIEGKSRQLNWYFFDDGVVIDVPGDFVLRGNRTANHRGWNTIMRLLQKHRPQRPLDGLILTIPCTDLLGSDQDNWEFELEQKATCLYKKLWQAQRILGMRLPVYIVITKCDEVTGFNTFCNQLPERLHAQMFGWSNPAAIETAYEPGLLRLALESVHKHLSWLQFEIFAERDEVENSDGLFLFPTSIQLLRKPLQVYLDNLFKQSAYHESYLFRGLYFCGEAAVESLPQVMAEMVTRDESFADLSLQETPVETVLERKPVFLSDLFKEKIFNEASLAQPIGRIALSRNRMALAAQLLTIAVVLIGGGGLALSYRGMLNQEAQLYSFLQGEEADLKKVEAAYQRSRRITRDESEQLEEHIAHDNETKLLAGMADMNGNKFDSPFIPSSWFSGINERLETSIAAAFEYVIFESLRVDMERQGKSLLYVAPGNLRNFESETEAAAKNPVLPDEDFEGAAREKPRAGFELHVYLEELGDYRANLERYNKLITKDNNSLADLRQLVRYLNHAPLPDKINKDTYLYKQALTIAEGRPIDCARFYKESVTKVGDLIEDFYSASFDRRGVKYEHLNDLAETEALLSRPEYTWISTNVFDPHSPFHGMTISTGVRELRKALQDLRRQEFMAEVDVDEFSDLPQSDDTRYQHFVRRVLVWDQEALRQAIALNDQYEAFVSSNSYERGEYLDNSVKQAARARLKTRMSKVFRQARKYQALAPATEGSALRSSLIMEIKSLQEAQPTLSRVLQIATPLGIDAELRSALSTQVSYLLRGIHREFVGQQFYEMKRRDFSWWNGSQPVSYLAYDLASLEDVNTYLTLQRKNVAFLARDLAVPLLTFAASENIYAESTTFDWNEILGDLDAFENKLPGNPIASLENFIATDMDKVSIDSCSASLRLPKDDSKDYFRRLRNTMRAQFFYRCTELARIKAVNDTLAALENYREIEESFNKSLAGGFPFTDLSTRPDYPDLDPWEMLKFFRLFDAREKAAREALARSVEFGAGTKEASEFLDQVVLVREFFAPFLEKKQGPVLDFKVQFRVNGDHEIGANQIIDWKFEVGKKKFAYLNDDLEGRWVFGDPIRLSLRWANNSPVVPVTSAQPVPVKAKDRIATFVYDDHWSLFTLLLRHGPMLKRVGTQAECDQSFDSEPYTLRFSVKTEPDAALQSPQRSELKTADAEVFMRVSLAKANKQEPLMLPCFPRKAPPVPALHLRQVSEMR
jgi:type VI secretion system protein ImpL